MRMEDYGQIITVDDKGFPIRMEIVDQNKRHRIFFYYEVKSVVGVRSSQAVCIKCRRYIGPDVPERWGKWRCSECNEKQGYNYPMTEHVKPIYDCPYELEHFMAVQKNAK